MRNQILAAVAAVVIFAGGFLLGRETAPSLVDQLTEISQEGEELRDSFDEISSGLAP